MQLLSEDVQLNKSRRIEKHGYDGLGEEILYNGMTGQQLKGKVSLDQLIIKDLSIWYLTNNIQDREVQYKF